jgi:hypothetical protein
VSDQKFSQEFYDRWEHLLSTVEISDVPIEYISEIVVVFHSDDTTVFDITAMIASSAKPKHIEAQIEDFLSDHDDEIDHVNFHINIPVVATDVNEKTKKLLGK